MAARTATAASASSGARPGSSRASSGCASGFGTSTARPRSTATRTVALAASKARLPVARRGRARVQNKRFYEVGSTLPVTRDNTNSNKPRRSLMDTVS